MLDRHRKPKLRMVRRKKKLRTVMRDHHPVTEPSRISRGLDQVHDLPLRQITHRESIANAMSAIVAEVVSATRASVCSSTLRAGPRSACDDHHFGLLLLQFGQDLHGGGKTTGLTSS